MDSEEKIKQILAKTQIKVHSDLFSIISIEKGNENKVKEITKNLTSFSSITYDIEEISLVVKETDWIVIRDHFDSYQEDGPFCLITFDIILDLSIVGFMAFISRKLAEKNVSIYVISTYLRDHILVKKADCTKTVEILLDLIEECRVTYS
jgi:hypothetical protein